MNEGSSMQMYCQSSRLKKAIIGKSTYMEINETQLALFVYSILARVCEPKGHKGIVSEFL